MSAQQYSTFYPCSALLGLEDYSRSIMAYEDPSAVPFGEYIDWTHCEGDYQEPAPFVPTTEENSGPLHSTPSDLLISLLSLPPHSLPPVTVDVPTDDLPTLIVCPLLTVPHLDQPRGAVSNLSDMLPGENIYHEEQCAINPFGAQSTGRPSSPAWSDGTSSTSTNSSPSLSSSIYIPFPSSSSTPSNVSSTFNAPMAPTLSSPSKVTRNLRKEDDKRPRSKGSALLTKGVQRMPASRKARNVQVNEMPEDINTLMDRKTLFCLVCNRRRAKRIPDLRRHVLTHCGHRFACLGTPSTAHTPCEADSLIHRGIVMAGGCGATFTRDDAYLRHMHRTSCKGPTKLANNFLDKEEVDALKVWLRRE